MLKKEKLYLRWKKDKYVKLLDKIVKRAEYQYEQQQQQATDKKQNKQAKLWQK